MPAASPEGTLTVDRRSSQTSTPPASQPSRFVAGVWLVLIAELSWAVAGVTLAMAGIFSLWTLLPLWAALAAALWVASRSARAATPRSAQRSTRWIRVAALTIVVSAVVLNAAFPGEHLQTGRDGGTYTATAGWLTTDGGLRIDAIVAPFDDTTDLEYDAAGFHEVTTDGPLYAQFMHAFPAMLATVELLGGPALMVRTNALLGGLALLAFYAFAERLIRPWAALVAQIALAANLVFIYFTRAPFSELLTMGMLFAGLWALDQAVTQRNRLTGFLAGLFIGATFIARLDGLVMLLMVIVALLPPVVRGRLREVSLAVLTGIGVSAVIAVFDLFVFSPFYVLLHVSFLVPLGLGFVAAAVIGIVAVTSPARRAVRTIMRHRRRVAAGLALLIVTAGVLAYVVRPSFAVATWDRTTPIGYLQQAEGQVIDEARTYAEQSARWLGWYLGVPALALALLGWAQLVRRAVEHRTDRLAPFLLTLSGLTVLYIWMPSITPDHIWADRRFLPVVYPGLIVCAAWAIDRAWRSEAARSRRTAALAGVTLAVVLLVGGPLVRSVPLLNLHEQAGFAADVAAACDRLGDDAALLLLDEEDSAMHYRMTQPLRAHCGVPAAWTSASISNDRLLEIAGRAGDRTLYVLAEHPETLEGRPVGPVTTLIEHRGVRLEQTLTVPPRNLSSYGLDVLAAPVTPATVTTTS
jgi:hypothetical protein